MLLITTCWKNYRTPAIKPMRTMKLKRSFSPAPDEPTVPEQPSPRVAPLSTTMPETIDKMAAILTVVDA